jgi:hypothetical protein
VCVRVCIDFLRLVVRKENAVVLEQAVLALCNIGFLYRHVQVDSIFFFVCTIVFFYRHTQVESLRGLAFFFCVFNLSLFYFRHVLVESLRRLVFCLFVWVFVCLLF